jgi:hypothetical protein
LYFDPERARLYLNQKRGLRPPPGWVALTELKDMAGRSKQALSTYLKRHAVQTKRFMHPERDQLVLYVSQGDADTYLAALKPSEADEAMKVLADVEQTPLVLAQPVRSETPKKTPHRENPRPPTLTAGVTLYVLGGW